MHRASLGSDRLQYMAIRAKNCTTSKFELGILILPISCLFLPISGAFVSDGTCGVSSFCNS